MAKEKNPEQASSEEQEGAEQEKQHYPWNETIRSVMLALLVALVFRSCAYEPFHIPSGSMKDTLLINDYIFVSKYSYGYSRYSFPFGLDLFDGRILSDERPERGDVVVFRLPSRPDIDFIKRVVGLPGDRIQVKHGVLYINGKPVELEQIDDFREKRGKDRIVTIRRYLETLPNGHTHSILDDTQDGRYDNTYIYTVPPEHYFMMGDNRDHSSDSRTATVGFVPEENIVGRAELILFSVDARTSIWKIWDWPWALRTDRLFEDIR